MTTVTFVSLEDTQLFECVGHTGYGKVGSDLLCSAVSCLCYTLFSYLSSLEERGEITNLVSSFSDGCMTARFEYTRTADKSRINEGLYSVFCGFRLLSESFPDHIDAEL